MAEFKKEISLAATLAAMAALGVGLFAIIWFPAGTPITSVTSNSSTSVIVPRLFLGVLYTQNVSCSLESGVCDMIVVNSGTTPAYDVVPIACSMDLVLSSNNTITTFHVVQGTIGGPITAGVPHGTSVGGTCSVPISQLSHQSTGSAASGTFTVALVNSYGSYPSGTEAIVDFEGAWS